MKLSEDVLIVLSGLAVAPQGAVRIVDKLDRALYLKTNQALEALGGKWARKVGAHVFADLDEEQIRTRLDIAIAMGEVSTAADLGFFATPFELAGEIIAMADIQAHHAVLEPSAGDGALYNQIKIYSPAFVGLVERDPTRRNSLMLMQRDCDEVCSHDDFMDFEETEPYDRVVMNPPFHKVGKGDHLDHVRHAYGMLAPGGILVSVLPAGVRFRTDKRHTTFRSWALDRGALTDLPDGSFKASGTNVRTCVLKVTR
jgi:type I restriction-modification system DNA methylase subunit